MTALEERLRQEMQAESELISPDSLERLRLPGAAWHRPAKRRTRWTPRTPEVRRTPGVRWIHRTRRTPQRGGPQRPPVWARPLASAAAAMAVVVAPLAFVHQAAALSPGGAGVSVPGPPLYYAYAVPQALTHGSTSPGSGSQTAALSSRVEVRSTGTGRLLTTVKAHSPYNDIFAMTADAAGSAFVFALVRTTWQGGSNGSNGSNGKWDVDWNVPLKLMHLTVAAGGRTSLSGLPAPGIPAAPGSVSIALSPDGSRLAVAYGDGHGAVVQTVALTTGFARRWFWPFATWSPSLAAAGAWTANGKTLAFRALLPTAGSGKAANEPTMVGLIDTAAPTAGSGSATFLALPPLARPLGRARQLFMTPDGSKLIASFTTREESSWIGELAVYSARTGVLQHLSGRWESPAARGSPAEFVLWSSLTGSQLMVTQPVGHSSGLGLLAGDSFTTHGQPLPGLRNAYRQLSFALCGVHATAGCQPVAW